MYVRSSSSTIYPGRMKSDIGAGALVSVRMLALDRLTLDLVWRHLELDPLSGVFCTACAGIRVNLLRFLMMTEIASLAYFGGLPIVFDQEGLVVRCRNTLCLFSQSGNNTQVSLSFGQIQHISFVLSIILCK